MTRPAQFFKANPSLTWWATTAAESAYVSTTWTLPPSCEMYHSYARVPGSLLVPETTRLLAFWYSRDGVDAQGLTKRWTKASAVSATSPQPLSIVNEWPRPFISTISVTPGLRFSSLYDALATAHGTVWSRSPEMMSSGPRSGFLVSTLASVQGLRFAAAAWKIGSPEPGTANSS